MRIAARVAGLICAAGLALAGAGAAEVAGQTAQFETTTEVFRIQVGLQRADGSPFSGLSGEDLELLVNGQPRRILDMREIDASRLTPAPAAPPDPELPPTAAQRLPSTVLQPADRADLPTAARRRFLLFFDLGFINRRGLGYARGAATNFLDKIAREGDMIGLATYSGNRGLQYHVPFTSDRAQIRREVEAMGVGRAAESIDNGLLDLDELARALGALDGGDASALDIAQELELTQRQIEVGRIIMAIESMAETIAPLQGRKHILYFSASIPDELLFSPENGDGGNLRDMVTAVESARRSDVVIHTFLPAVLPVADMHDVTKMQSTFQPGAQLRMGGDRGFLDFVAAETGGTANFFRHQMRDGLEKVEESTRSYYVVAFPVLDTDGATVSIQIRPRRPEVQVAWAPTLLTLPRGQEHSVASRQLQIADALEMGNDVRDVAVDVLAIRLPSESGYGRVAIVGEIPARQLRQLVDDRGDDRLELEILGAALTPGGTVADYFRTRVNLDNVAAKLAGTSAPLRYQNVLAVPPGTYFVKVLVREAKLSRMASRSLRLEIPTTEPTRLAIETPLMVLPALPGSFVRGVDPENAPSHRARLPLAYPFVVGSQEVLPVIRPTTSASADVDFLVTVRAPQRDPLTNEATLSAQAWLENDRGDRFVVSGAQILATTPVASSDAIRLLLRLSMSPALPSGRYSLIVQVADHVAGKAVASWTELTVEGRLDRVR